MKSPVEQLPRRACAAWFCATASVPNHPPGPHHPCPKVRISIVMWLSLLISRTDARERERVLAIPLCCSERERERGGRTRGNGRTDGQADDGSAPTVRGRSRQQQNLTEHNSLPQQAGSTQGGLALHRQVGKKRRWSLCPSRVAVRRQRETASGRHRRGEFAARLLAGLSLHT